VTKLVEWYSKASGEDVPKRMGFHGEQCSTRGDPVLQRRAKKQKKAQRKGKKEDKGGPLCKHRRKKGRPGWSYPSQLTSGADMLQLLCLMTGEIRK